MRSWWVCCVVLAGGWLGCDEREPRGGEARARPAAPTAPEASAPEASAAAPSVPGLLFGAERPTWVPAELALPVPADARELVVRTHGSRVTVHLHTRAEPESLAVGYHQALADLGLAVRKRELGPGLILHGDAPGTKKAPLMAEQSVRLVADGAVTRIELSGERSLVPSEESTSRAEPAECSRVLDEAARRVVAAVTGGATGDVTSIADHVRDEYRAHVAACQERWHVRDLACVSEAREVALIERCVVLANRR